MMTNEELFYLLQKFYPGTINGTHYLTGHRLDTEGKQFGEAFLQFWNLPDPQPSKGQLLGWWDEHKAEIQDTVAGVHHRWERAERLLRADALVYRAEDAGDKPKAAAARAYRQALRDVPQQAGFPRAFAWPVPPEDDEVQNVARRDAVLLEVEKAAANPRAVMSMPDDLLPPAEHVIFPDLLPDPPPPMAQYGNLEAHYAAQGIAPTTPPSVPSAPGDAEIADQGPQPIVPVLDQPADDYDLPHPPDQLPPLPDVPVEPVPESEPVPFTPSPEPSIDSGGNAAVLNELAMMTDPVAKLHAFLSANPDVVNLIESYVPPDHEPPSDDGGTT